MINKAIRTLGLITVLTSQIAHTALAQSARYTNKYPDAKAQPTYVKVGSTFSDPRTSYFKNMPRIDATELANLTLGLDKDQVRALLGNPHFHEGILGVKAWNYLFEVREPHSHAYKQCQFKINFMKGEESTQDKKEHTGHYEFFKDDIVKEIFWKDPACQKIVEQSL